MRSFTLPVVVLGLIACSFSVFAQERTDRNFDRYDDRYRDRYQDYNPNYRYRSDDTYRYERPWDYETDRYGDRDERYQWNRQNIQMSKLPASVQKTIRRQVDDADVVRIDKESNRGKVQYRVQTRGDRQRGYFRVGADGALINASDTEFYPREYSRDYYYPYRDRDPDRYARPYYDERDYVPPRDYNRYDRYRTRDEGYYRSDYESRPTRPYNADPYRERYDPRSGDRYGDYRSNYPNDERYGNPASEDRVGRDRDWSRQPRPNTAERDYRYDYQDADRDRENTRSRDSDRYGDRDFERSESRRDPDNSEQWDRQNIRLSDLPASVQKSVKKHVGEGTITRIDRETHRGQVRYGVRTKHEGKENFFRLSSNGEFLGAHPEEEHTTPPDQDSKNQKDNPADDSSPDRAK